MILFCGNGKEAAESSVDSASFAQTYGTTWDTLSDYKNVEPCELAGTGIWQKSKIHDT